MPIENGRPVIFLAFANMEGDLPELHAEIRQLQELFEAFQGEGRCTLVFKPNATLEQIFNILTEQLNRIAIFHYGGHADGGRLMLESALGRAPAYGPGLATLLGQQRGLQLAFLNGCSTRPQVQRLLDSGVPAVVATARAIDDRVVREFAVAFYTALTKGGDSIQGGQNLHGAFEAAKGFAMARGGGQARGLLTRDLGGDDVADALGFPWDLLDRPGAEKVRRWNLFDDDPLFGLPSLPPGGLPTEGPFRYLDWFTAEHAEVFFGRGHQIRELYELVIGSGTPPVILLYGQSGVGKSSLLDAGLVPRLKATHEVRYRRRDAKTGLIETLRGALGSTDAGQSIGAAWQAEEARLGKPLVVILDQVEEALIGGDSPTNGFGDSVEAVRTAFDDTSSTPKGKLVLGFRKEWLAEIEKRFSEARMRGAPMYLEPLDRRGVIEAVRGPGTLFAQDGRKVERPVLSPRLSTEYGLQVEEDLPDLIADDLLSDPGSPVAPTLQILLSKMWDLAKKQDLAHPRFDRALYEQMKREGIHLSDFLNQQFDRLRAWRPEAVDSGLALDLLTFYTTPLGTSRQQNVDDLFQAYGHIDSRELSQLLQQCKTRRLLVDPAGHDGDRELSENRLAHDTLAPLVRERFDKSNDPGQARDGSSRTGRWIGRARRRGHRWTSWT